MYATEQQSALAMNRFFDATCYGVMLTLLAPAACDAAPDGAERLSSLRR